MELILSIFLARAQVWFLSVQSTVCSNRLGVSAPVLIYRRKWWLSGGLQQPCFEHVPRSVRSRSAWDREWFAARTPIGAGQAPPCRGRHTPLRWPTAGLPRRRERRRDAGHTVGGGFLRGAEGFAHVQNGFSRVFTRNQVEKHREFIVFVIILPITKLIKSYFIFCKGLKNYFYIE